MNAATGQALNGPSALQLEVGGALGGLYAAGAVDQQAGLIFRNGLNWPFTSSSPVRGDIFALTLTGTELWDFKTAGANGSGVAIANGVVYFQSMDGNLYMLNEHAASASNALIASVYTGGQYGAPAVADGHIFLGTGNALSGGLGSTGPASIVSLGLPSDGADDAMTAASGIQATTATGGPTSTPASLDLVPANVVSIPSSNSPASAAVPTVAIDNALDFLVAATPRSPINQDRMAGTQQNPWAPQF